jgi:Cu+-exporting ATPase
MEIKKEDPVCGKSVDPLKSTHQHTHDGTRYHFCSVGCKDKFVADIGAYLGDRAPAPPADASPIFICPNLPEVDQDGPGDCPFCGSRLEPKDPIAALDEDENPEPVDTRRRSWASLVRKCWPWTT